MATLEVVYRLHPADNVAFAVDAAPQERAEPLFRVRLAGGVATFTMRDPSLSDDEARRIAGEYTRTWEISAGLAYGRPLGRFVFAGLARESDEGVCITPAPATARASAGVPLPLPAHPEPPQDFVIDADVAEMWTRYLRYQEGRERLLSMASFCLNVLENRVGGGGWTARRTEIEKRYGIELALTMRLGAVAAKMGDAGEARKLYSGSTRRPITPQVRTEIEQVVRAMIQRAGERAYDPNRAWPRLIELADYRALTDLDV